MATLKDLTEDQAHEMASKARELGVTARVEGRDFAPTNPDGSYTGEVVKRYSVELVLRDAKHGNTVVRRLDEPANVATVVEDMTREIKARAKAAKTVRRAEKGNDRS